MWLFEEIYKKARSVVLKEVGIIGVVVFVVFLVGIFFLGCEKFVDTKTPKQLSDAGVVVNYGYWHGKYSDPWMKNMNTYPVRVKKVYIFSGERTIWIKVLQPGEKNNLPDLSPQDGFHIFTMDGVEVGWISDYDKPLKQ